MPNNSDIPQPSFSSEDHSSSDSHFSPDGHATSNSHAESKENSQTIRPKFVLIDERDGVRQETYFEADSSDSSGYSRQTFQENQESKNFTTHAYSLRFISLLGIIFCLIFGTGVFIGFGVAILFAVLSLFQNKILNQRIWKLWKLFVNTVIACFGFLLGILYPPLGFGLLALYFSLKTQSGNEDFLRRFVRRSFNRF